MRRLDLRPTKKLRNPGRHLRSLERWPHQIELELPEAHELVGARYWNYKVPVFSKLVEPPHATDETRKALFVAMFRAAETIENSPARPDGCRVAVLASTPFMFESEVTLFPDDEYFGSFVSMPGRKRTEMAGGGWIEAERVDADSIAHLLPAVPAGLHFHGGTLLTQYDPEWNEQPVARINWVWAYNWR